MPGLRKITVAQRSVGMALFQFAQLVAQDVQVGLAAIHAVGGVGLTQQRTHQNGQDDQEKRGSAKEKSGGSAHDFDSSEWSSRSACCRSASLNGTSPMTRERRRRNRNSPPNPPAKSKAGPNHSSSVVPFSGGR